jgi:O-antigen/teichoic acid export membrane protein
MALNSLALILAKVSTMGLGFVAWLLAARLFAAAEVGIASAVVSAITLCSQIALLGISSAIISLYPTHRDAPGRLLNTAYGITAGAAVVAGGLFLIVASAVFTELRVVSSMPLYIALFLLMSVLGTLDTIVAHIQDVLGGIGSHVQQESHYLTAADD